MGCSCAIRSSFTNFWLPWCGTLKDHGRAKILQGKSIAGPLEHAISCHHVVGITSNFVKRRMVFNRDCTVHRSWMVFSRSAGRCSQLLHTRRLIGIVRYPESCSHTTYIDLKKWDTEEDGEVLEWTSCLYFRRKQRTNWSFLGNEKGRESWKNWKPTKRKLPHWQAQANKKNELKNTPSRLGPKQVGDNLF